VTVFLPWKYFPPERRSLNFYIWALIYKESEEID